VILIAWSLQGCVTSIRDVTHDFCLLGETPTYGDKDTELTKHWMDRYAVVWDKYCIDKD
jgi:hypothetical protein